MPTLTNFLVKPQPRTRPFNVCDTFYTGMCTGFRECRFSVFSICKSLRVDMNNEQKMMSPVHTIALVSNRTRALGTRQR